MNAWNASFFGHYKLPQLGIFGLGGDEDGNVRVGVLPEREKIFVSGERPNAGGVGIRPCEVFASKALAHATPKCANAPVQQFQTMPLWSRIF